MPRHALGHAVACPYKPDGLSGGWNGGLVGWDGATFESTAMPSPNRMGTIFAGGVGFSSSSARPAGNTRELAANLPESGFLRGAPSPIQAVSWYKREARPARPCPRLLGRALLRGRASNLALSRPRMRRETGTKYRRLLGAGPRYWLLSPPLSGALSGSRYPANPLQAWVAHCFLCMRHFLVAS